MSDTFVCPECGEELTEITSIRTYIKTLTISKEGVPDFNTASTLEYVSTDDYECPKCYAVLNNVKDF